MFPGNIHWMTEQHKITYGYKPAYDTAVFIPHFIYQRKTTNKKSIIDNILFRTLNIYILNGIQSKMFWRHNAQIPKVKIYYHIYHVFKRLYWNLLSPFECIMLLLKNTPLVYLHSELEITYPIVAYIK